MDGQNFHLILKLPFEHGTKQLLASNSNEKVREFLNFLLQEMEKEASSEIIQKSLTWCTWILCGGNEPKSYLKFLKSNSKSKMCNVVWNDGYYFYRCRDCEMSPSSSVCYDCFKNGNHEGHDFLFEKSVYGGCCDCGNPDAWKSSGFCLHHSGTLTEDPATFLPEPTKTLSQIVLQILVQKLCSYCLQQKDTLALSVSQWLRFITSHSEGLIHFLRRFFVDAESNFENFPPYSLDSSKRLPAPSSFHPPLDVIIRACLHLNKKTIEEIIFLYLDLFQDIAFKEVFLPFYIAFYPTLIKDSKNGMNIIYKISPQLFSISPLAIRFSKQDKLVDTLINSSLSLFQTLCTEKVDNKPLIINCNSEFIVDHTYYAFTNDLNTVLENPTIASFIFLNRLDLLQTLTHLIELFQGMNPMKRMTNQHVKYENQAWKFTFYLEVEISRSVVAIVDSFVHYSPGSVSATSCSKVIGIFLDSFLQWTKQQNFHSLKYEDQDIIEMEVDNDTVSFHFPIQRVIGRFLHLFSIKLHPQLPLSTWINDGFPFTYLFDYAIQIYVLLSQIRSDYWIRNGTNMYHQAFLYRCPFFMEIFNIDLFLLQAGVILTGPKVFFHLLLKRFNLFQYLSFQKQNQNDSINISILKERKTVIEIEDFLKLIVNILTERNKLGEDLKETLRKGIIHQLAVEDNTHSKLCDLMNFRSSERRELDSVLEEVAECISASTNNSPSVYKLKKEFWKEFNPYFAHYDSKDAQKANERYLQHRGTTCPYLRIKPLPSNFVKLGSLLHLCDFHRSLFLLLQLCSQDESFQYISILKSTLYLIKMCLDNPLEIFPSSFKQSPFFEDFKSSVRSNEANSLNLLLQLYKKVESNLELKDLLFYLTPILQTLSNDFINRNIILENLPNFETDEGTNQVLSDFDLKKKKGLERQKLILEQFRSQQQQFLKSSAGSLTESREKEEIIEEDEEKEDIDKDNNLCALCHTGSKNGAPLGRICLIQPSRVLIESKQQIYEKMKNFLPYRGYLQMFQPLFDLKESKMEEETNTMEEKKEKKGATNLIQSEKPIHSFFRDVSDSVLLSFQSCGHFMHKDCVNGFFHSLRSSQSVNFLGEFFPCPVCRRFSNSLLPDLKIESIKLNSNLISLSWEEWWNSNLGCQNNWIFDKTNNELSSWKPLHFHQLSISDSSFNQSTLTLWESLLGKILQIELISRQKIGLKSFLQNNIYRFMTDLQILGTFCLVRSMRSNIEERKFFFNQFVNCIKGKIFSKSNEPIQIDSEDLIEEDSHEILTDGQVEKSMNSVPPILITDLFSVMGRFLLLKPIISSQEFFATVKLFYFLNLTQTFLQLLINPNITTTSNSENQFYTEKELSEKEETEIPDFTDTFFNLEALNQFYSFIQKHFSKQENKNVLLLNKEIVLKVFKPITHSFSKKSTLLGIALQVIPSSFSISTFHWIETLKSLQIPTITSFLKEPLSFDLIQLWIQQLQHDYYPSESRFSFQLSVPQPISFIKLPSTYQELILQFVGIKCPKCNTVPKYGAMCLFCGKLCCVNSKCCFENNLGECSYHSNSCGGLFIVLKTTQTLILRGSRRIISDSLYLDQYGEEDPNLRRGKTLFLSQDRYWNLLGMWIANSFDQDTKLLSYSASDGFFF